MSASPVGVPARFGALLDRLPSPMILGTVATVLIAASSFGAGAIRNRGGVLDALGLNVLAYGHAAGVCGSILWLGIFLLVAAWILVGRRTVFAAADAADGDARGVGNLARTFLGPLADDRRLGAVVRATTAWTLPLLLAAPILSRDVYSYLMQGAMLRDGFDPYTQGAAANPGPMLLEVSHDWRNTTTPYGPLHLWLGEGITRLVGDNITAGVVLYKLVSVVGMAAILWAVPRIAARLGADPALATWLGAANPVMVLHMVGGMHNESLMVGLVSLGLVAALDRRFVAGVALIAVAVSLKATAAIALPFVVWLATRHLGTRLTRRAAGPDAARRATGPDATGPDATDSTTASSPDAATDPDAADLPLSAIPRGRAFGAFLGAGAACTAGTVAVISLVTWASGASWGWLAEISGNSKVINPLSLPSLLAGLVTDSVRVLDDSFTFNAPLGVFRTIGSVLMLLGLVVVWWLFRETDRQAVRGIAVAYAVAFVFNAVSLPWYYASLLTLIAVTPVPRALVQWTAGVSVVLAVAFTGSGNHQLYNVAFMAIAALCAWVAVGALAVPDRSPVNAAATRGVGKQAPARPGAEKTGAGKTDAGAH